jgi:hypothetical protein
LINNYKAQRNVRAELGGAVDLGHPVSLYIKEDEVKYSSKNLATNGKFQDGTVTPFTTGTGSFQMDVVELATNPVSGRTSLRLQVGDENDVAQGDFDVSVGKTYKFSFNRTIPNHDSNSKCKFRLGIPGDVKAYADIISFTSNTTTGVFRESLVFTATNSTLEFRIGESGNDNDAEIFIDDIQLYEVVDHSYKLMAINDTIPSQGINTEAEGSEMITDDKNQIFDEAGQWVGYGSPTSAGIVGGKFQVETTGDSSVEGASLPVANLTAPVVGRTYRIRAKLDDVGTANPDADYKFFFGGAGERITASDGSPTGGVIDTTEQEYYADVVAINTTGNLEIRIVAADNDAATTFTIDDVSVKEVLGYDYYNAPAYKFGIVSSVYDQSTGAMKTSGVEGDEVDVTVQGECTVRSASQSKTQNHLIGRISNSGAISNYAKSDNTVLPNSVGVMVETTTSATSHPIILWQGVEFSEHFVHKNSLQVMAKCDETITKFRPVSLFLDSNGDLLCRHDDIPAEVPDADTDHTGVDPGKWGIAELGGVSGDIIPSNNIPPNALGTYLEGNATGSYIDLPISIFGGTPIGTITDWKRTIKVTAKANGAITQYCPVSLYLDQYGNYKCISDDIPNEDTDVNNGTWCDFRKWGISQETVADGENVEIIVQGRTKVNNVKDSCNRQDYVKRIASNGTVVGTSTNGYQLSMLGIVEKESKTSEGEPGVIIIF